MRAWLRLPGDEHSAALGEGPRHAGDCDALTPQPGGPFVGAAAVLTRFIVTDRVETLPQALQRRKPSIPPKLPLAAKHYYRAQLLLLPAFGLAEWLLMSGVARGVVRLTDQPSQLSRVLDLIGLGMLVPMPALWLSDSVMLATDTYRLPGLAVTHSAVQLCETAQFSVGLHAQGASWAPAVAAGSTASAVYVLGGATLIR